jgi:hypothetical protein
MDMALRRLFTAQPVDQRSQVAIRVGEMLGSFAFSGRMLAAAPRRCTPEPDTHVRNRHEAS